MARRGRGKTHRLTLRVPEDVYDDYLALAVALHMDAGGLMTQKLISLRFAVRRELKALQDLLAASAPQIAGAQGEGEG